MKGLIENECGGQNPLMKLTAHFTSPANEQTLSQEAMRQQKQKLPEPHQLVSEYLAIESEKHSTRPLLQQQHQNQFLRRLPAPRSFQMEALFNELKHMDSLHAASSVNKSTSISTSALNTPVNVATVNAGSTKSSDENSLSQTEINGLSRSVSPSKLNAIRSISQVTNNLAQDWSQEYWASLSAAFKKQSPMIIDDRTFKWSADYLTQTEATILDEAYVNFVFLLKTGLS